MTLPHARTLALVGSTLAWLACAGDRDAVGPLAGTGAAAVVLIDPPAEGTDAQAALTLSGRATVALSFEGEDWIEEGPEDTVALRLQSGDSAVVGPAADVPAGRYRFVRLRLHEALVTVPAGTPVGGDPLPGEVVLALGADGEAEIVKRLPSFTVGEGELRLVFDLNSPAWISAAVLQDGIATDAMLQAATRVRVRTAEPGG